MVEDGVVRNDLTQAKMDAQPQLVFAAIQCHLCRFWELSNTVNNTVLVGDYVQEADLDMPPKKSQED